MSPEIVRGSPERISNHKEQLQLGYLRAVVAAAGCVIVGEPTIDEGTDIMIKHRRREPDNTIRDAFLELQLKATESVFDPSAQYVTAKMRRDRYDEYRSTNLSVPKIVVVMTLPGEQKDWVTASHDALTIRHCSYWVNLAGAKASTAQRPTFRAPTANVLDDVALCLIMERIHNGGQP
ncbi:DUF4365 domain-containing protein [Glutamicibacter soli]|uniref:DUF4365 domain-containing protein n=1 Tax=Glutamicibacter soli TaxID=453836 RepID=UPI0015EF9C54|nr:DUF4365 domain-containing protein [Glutamicibacter soli]